MTLRVEVSFAFRRLPELLPSHNKTTFALCCGCEWYRCPLGIQIAPILSRDGPQRSVGGESVEREHVGGESEETGARRRRGTSEGSQTRRGDRKLWRKQSTLTTTCQAVARPTKDHRATKHVPPQVTSLCDAAEPKPSKQKQNRHCPSSFAGTC